MRRIISLICATTLTLAGAFLVYIELAWPHSQSIPGRLIMLPVLYDRRRPALARLRHSAMARIAPHLDDRGLDVL